MSSSEGAGEPSIRSAMWGCACGCGCQRGEGASGAIMAGAFLHLNAQRGLGQPAAASVASDARGP